METQLETLKRTLASAHAQVSALKHQHSLLLSTLLTHPQTPAILSGTTPAARAGYSTTSEKDADRARKHASAHALSHHARTLRAATGLTAFLVEDPDPNARSKSVLGVRIDGVSKRSSLEGGRVSKKQRRGGKDEGRGFTRPWFLFFEIVDADSGRVRLHRHTIPGSIPLRGLVDKYLGPDSHHSSHTPNDHPDDPMPDTTTDPPSPQENPQDLHAFIRAVRHETLSLTRRLSALSALRSTVPSDSMHILAPDPAGRRFDMVFPDGTRAKASLATDGTIDGAVVRSVDSTGIGRRRRDVERVILGEGARIEGLGARLARLG